MLESIVLPFPIHMIPAFQTRILSFLTQTICIGGQCLNLCSLMDFVFFSWMRFLRGSGKNYPTMPRMVIFPGSAPQRKLTPNLRDKVKYVIHYRKLKLYLQLGLVITTVPRVLTFKQSPWLKANIDYNTRQQFLQRRPHY